MSAYVLGIDQSTQGTKALLFDAAGRIAGRADLTHRQIVNGQGWVSHDLQEIYRNTVRCVKALLASAGTDGKNIAVAGISNQRETACAWDASTGESVCGAVVWQCARAADVCARIERENPGVRDMVRAKTGLALSPYFTAAKFAWILENVPAAQCALEKGNLRLGTVDSYLVWNLTRGRVFRTDCSNAARTQLFDIRALRWDSDLCRVFGVPEGCLPEVVSSDGDFGTTDFGGALDHAVPVRCVMGDSNGALFGQDCRRPGGIKCTYGTGSSVMMNTGAKPAAAENLSVSLAWTLRGETAYVLEGNVNHSGAVISWMQHDLRLFDSAAESAALSLGANPADKTFLVPAFSGLGAPYWDSGARAVFCGMSRTTGRAELVRAGLESIAQQVTDILETMRRESGLAAECMRADGGAAKNAVLMQMQSDLAPVRVEASNVEELSGMGVAYAAGIAEGIYDGKTIFSVAERTAYEPRMPKEKRRERRDGWAAAVRCARLR